MAIRAKILNNIGMENLIVPLTETQAASESAAAELRNSAANAAEAAAKAQRALLDEAVAAGAALLEPRIKSIETWQGEHTEIFKGLATKKDIEELTRVFGNIKNALSVIATGSKWGYKGLLVLAGAIGATLVVLGGIKAAIAGIIAWASGQ